MTEEAPKKRILFVDDEPEILGALKNLLFRDRKKWDISFAVGPEEALVALRAAPFDAVVSDMRMPGMDGAALMAIVQEELPHAVRIILSGYADQAALERAAAVVHHWLAKPCDAARLRATLTSALESDQRGSQIDSGITRPPE